MPLLLPKPGQAKLPGFIILRENLIPIAAAEPFLEGSAKHKREQPVGSVGMDDSPLSQCCYHVNSSR